MIDASHLDAEDAYYAGRATKAQAFADRAANPQVRAIHLQMAERYRQLASTAAPMIVDDVQKAVDCISEALALLDQAGRTAEAAYLSTALEMLVADAEPAD